MRRQVAELDFRLPEFRDAKVEDYEFREDGKLVRKDRWESAVREIKSLVLGGTREFEIDDVVAAVRDLVIKGSITICVTLEMFISRLMRQPRTRLKSLVKTA
jgi:hypothetical protein